MRTFWPTAKSGAPPWTSRQLFISAPYERGIRCGTKKTKTSFGTTVKSRTKSRLAIGRGEVYLRIKIIGLQLGRAPRRQLPVQLTISIRDRGYRVSFP